MAFRTFASIFAVAAGVGISGGASAQDAEYYLPDYDPAEAAAEAAGDAQTAAIGDVLFEQRPVIQEIAQPPSSVSPAPPLPSIADAPISEYEVYEEYEEYESSGPAQRAMPAHQGRDYAAHDKAPHHGQVSHHTDAAQPRLRPLGYTEAERENWLADCRRRMAGPKDNGWGGALIGGLIGGVAGNRIAGRGNRTGGTLIGAGLGALAGTAIDKAEDRGRVDEAAEYCLSYLEDYENTYRQPGYGQQAYGYVPVMMVPVAMNHAQPAQRYRTKIVEYEEWVDAPVQKTARRTISKPAPKRQPAKSAPVKKLRYKK